MNSIRYHQVVHVTFVITVIALVSFIVLLLFGAWFWGGLVSDNYTSLVTTIRLPH